MTKHMLTCAECGKAFNAAYGSFFDPVTHQYTCPNCAARLRRGSRVKMPRAGGMVAKLAAAVLFAVVAVSPSESWSVDYMIISLAIAAAFAAWALIPYFRARREQKLEADYINRQRFEIFSEPKICPACGAPSKGRICEYCGTPLQ